VIMVIMQVILGQAVTDNIEEIVDVSAITAWDVLWAFLLILGGVIVSRLIRRPLRHRLAKRTSLPEGPINLLTKIVGWGVISVAVVFALPYLGVSVTPVLVLVLLAGVVLVVSGRGIVENYGAGVVLQAEGQFGPGDQIATNGQIGNVIRVSSRVVMLETLDGRHLVIPNTSVLTDPMEVLTTRPERRSELVVGLAYGTDLESARAILADATADASGVMLEPAVEVFVSEFGESSIDFLVWFWHRSDLQSAYEAKDAVARALDQACKENRLTISFPQRTLWLGNNQDQQTPPGQP